MDRVDGADDVVRGVLCNVEGDELSPDGHGLTRGRKWALRMREISALRIEALQKTLRSWISKMHDESWNLDFP